MKVPGPGLPWRRILLGAAAVGLVAGAVWMVNFYQTHAMPSVSLAGVPVGMRKQREIAEVAYIQAEKLKAEFHAGSEVKQPSLTEMGVYLDIPQSTRAAFAARRPSSLPGTMNAVAFWEEKAVPIALTVNERKLRHYLKTQFAAEYAEPEEPGLTYDPSINEFVLRPGKSGRGFDAREVSSAIRAAANNPRRLVFRAGDEAIAPGVPDASVGKTQDEANAQLLLRLHFLHNNKLAYYPEPEEIARWLRFVPDERAGRLSIRYDTRQMKDDIRNKLEQSINVYFGAAGEGKLVVRDITALVDDVAHALERGKSFEKEISVESQANGAVQ